MWKGGRVEEGKLLMQKIADYEFYRDQNKYMIGTRGFRAKERVSTSFGMSWREYQGWQKLKAPQSMILCDLSSDKNRLTGFLNELFLSFPFSVDAQALLP